MLAILLELVRPFNVNPVRVELVFLIAVIVMERLLRSCRSRRLSTPGVEAGSTSAETITDEEVGI